MNAKSLGIFALGSFFGVLGGIFATKKYYQNKSDEEIAEVKRVYTYKKSDEDKKDEKEDYIDNAVKETQDFVSLKKERTFSDEAQKIVKYNGYYNEEGKHVDPAEQEHPVDDDTETDEPYQIEAEEAGYGRDCVSTTYYVNDKILAETNNADAIDINESIGYDNIEKCLEIWKDDPEEPLYFRNEKIGLDYEVLMSEEDYNDYARALNGIE